MSAKIFSQIILFIVINFMTAASFAADSITPEAAEMNMMNFYHSPNYDEFIQSTSSLIEKTDDFTLYDFTTMVLDKHSDYANKIVNSFAILSDKEKQLLFTSLVATNNTEAMNQLKKSYDYKKPAVDFHTPKTLKNVAINDNPAVIDGLWAAYSATGDDAYLITILKYINADNEILIYGYEILNRQQLNQLVQMDGFSKDAFPSKEVKGWFDKRYGKNSEKMYIKAVVVSQAIRSFDSYRERDKTVASKYDKIIKQNPNLDYLKKINRAIGKS